MQQSQYFSGWLKICFLSESPFCVSWRLTHYLLCIPKLKANQSSIRFLNFLSSHSPSTAWELCWMIYFICRKWVYSNRQCALLWAHKRNWDSIWILFQVLYSNIYIRLDSAWNFSALRRFSSNSSKCCHK